MEYNCTINIVDAVMGAGKTSAAINYMNNNQNQERFLYITPLRSELERIMKACTKCNFVQPEERYKTDTKLRSIKYLVEHEKNIASTHALFHRFDKEMIDLCRAENYTLIMDEVTDVIEKYDLSKSDFELLLNNCVHIEEDTHLIKWNDDEKSQAYAGRFKTEKDLCDMNCLAYYGNSVMMWLFPIEVFNAFRKVYILTYKFNAQMQRYYYDYFKVPYSYLYVKGESRNEYSFTEEVTHPTAKYDYRSLIHICDHEKLNTIGELKGALSSTWYLRNKNNIVIKQLKNNLVNYFNNICKAKSTDLIWTTFKDYRHILKGKGYTKGFLAVNARSINTYADCHYVAYPVNRFLNPFIKKFFTQHDIVVDEEDYGLSEMLQFIWRSAIRKGEEIWVYVPSSRMRDLLEQWIEENSIKEEAMT